MNAPRINSPHELLKVTSDYAAARELMLNHMLGRLMVAEADHDIAAEAAVVTGMTDAEYVTYLATGNNDFEPTTTVANYSNALDAIEFDAISAADKSDSLRGHKITDVQPGQISLIQLVTRADSPKPIPSFVVDAKVSEDGRQMKVTKHITTDGETTEFPPTPLDYDVVFRAASLLLKRLEND